MKSFKDSKVLRAAVSVSMLAVLAACGGGGGSSGGDAYVTRSVGGTAAIGAPMANAAVTYECAIPIDQPFNTTTNSEGKFGPVVAALAFPCMGQAKAAANGPTYRGIMLGVNANGEATMNFTPLTDLFVEVVLASIGTGTTVQNFVDYAQGSRDFSVFVAGKSAEYRNAVITALLAALPAGVTLTSAQLSALRNGFENTTFNADGQSALDTALDVIGNAVLDNATAKANLYAAVRTAGQQIAKPPLTGGGTGGTGGTGGSTGGSGST